MVKLIYGIAGSGKTDLLKTSLMRNEYLYSQKKVYVIERNDYNEYSKIFNPQYITIIKPNSPQVNELIDAKDAEIIIDCEKNSKEFREILETICKIAEKNNNDIFITFQCFEEWQENICKNTRCLMIGHIDRMSAKHLENRFDLKLDPPELLPNFYFHTYTF